ncbi:spore germination protein [Paenibacillus psychroresistens]|nr:spore germination protein [Paenibacillus psychroresistens]
MLTIHEAVDSLQQYLGKPIDLEIKYMTFPHHQDDQMVLIYIRSIVDPLNINMNILDPIREAIAKEQITDEPLKDQPLIQGILASCKPVLMDNKEMADVLFEGNWLILVNQLAQGFYYNAVNWHNREMVPPEREVGLVGPRDAFTEDIDINLSLIRRRIRDNSIRIEEYVIGERSKTKVNVVYMDGLVNEKALGMFRDRIDDFKLDIVLDSTQIGYLISKQVYSPFPMFQLTERPDKAASSMLEGRFVVVVDTSPSVLIFPTTITCLYEASDDYYFSSIAALLFRGIRLLGLSITLFLPSLYVAITTVNQDVFRVQFMLAVTASREGIPYPSYIEVIIMLLLIELINEATVRLPRTIGGTATIVGGLIIGTAAAQAHLISYIMIVITATTAIGSYTAPNYMVGLAWRILSFLIVIMAIPLGLYGVVIGTGFIGLYLCHLHSFGVPYTAPFSTFRYKDLFRDAMTRVSRGMMRIRPSTYSREAAGKKRLEWLEQEDLF